MKGMELPISTLIIVVLALVILLAILALFYGVWKPGLSGISLEAAKNNACQILTSTGCNADPETIKVNDFDADRDGAFGTTDTGTGWTWGTSTCVATIATNGDNLASLCACNYGVDNTGCKEDVCKCS